MRVVLPASSARSAIPRVVLLAVLIAAAFLALALPEPQAQAVTHGGSVQPLPVQNVDEEGAEIERLLRRTPRADDELEFSDFTMFLGRWIHLLTATIWVGGHIYLVFVFPRTLHRTDTPTERLYSAYRGFSGLIIPAFLVLVLAGVMLRATASPAAPDQVADLAFGDFYGLFIIGKMVLATIAAAVGALTSFSLLPSLGKALELGGETSQAVRLAGRVRIASIVNLVIGASILFLAAGLANIHQLILVGLAP